jgi:hypothetical protein
MAGLFLSISTLLSTARGVPLERGSFCKLDKVEYQVILTSSVDRT